MALKYSRQRESIKANLMDRRDHPTADMVYADIRKIFPNISLGTVYRNLALLSDLGEIRKFAGEGGAERYDWETEPHNHFTCRKCGCVRDIGGQQTYMLREQMNQQFDGRIDDCSIMFYGVCAGCLAEEQSSNYSQLETGQI